MYMRNTSGECSFHSAGQLAHKRQTVKTSDDGHPNIWVTSFVDIRFHYGSPIRILDVRCSPKASLGLKVTGCI